MARIVNIKYCKDNIPRPLYAYNGIVIIFAKIHKNQFSIFLLAIYHIAVKKIPEVKSYSVTEQDIEENYGALSEIKKIFLDIEPDKISPKDALDLLYEIKKKLS